MSLTITNAAPRAILRGIKDESGRPAVYEAEQIPTHLPHIYLFTERGDTLPSLQSGAGLLKRFGVNSFDYRKQYATHQTVLANLVNGEGNAIMVQRLVPPGANPPATLRLSVDMICDEVPEYERDTNGQFKLSPTGELIPTGAMIQGCKLKWIVGPTIDPGTDGRLLESNDPRLLEGGDLRILETAVGGGTQVVGSMTNALGEQSTIYPIMDFEADSFGDYGNRIGLKLSAPNALSNIPIDDITVEEQRAYLYRLQIVERASEISTPVVFETLFGERYVDFAFKPDVINLRTEQEMSYDKVVVPAYSQEGSATREEIRPLIGDAHVYMDNLETVLSTVLANEGQYGYTSPLDEDKHMINIFSGYNYNGIPYEGIRVLGPADGGIILNENTTHYLSGGYDGVMTPETFDNAVRYQLENFGSLQAKVLDTALYPQSVIYDTGFTLDTKKAMLNVIGQRKDMWVVLSTQDVGLPQNNPAEETSIAFALQTRARMYPESEIYGTSVCRAMIVGLSGYMIDYGYKGLLPITLEVARNCARYMGAGNGFWDGDNRFDVTPNNQIKLFRNVNAEYLNASARGRQWEAGMIWAQSYDMRSLFIPAYQTVYDDDTSVINSAVNMMIAVELEKIADRSWRDLTGISDLTPAQFLERSDRLIERLAKGKFDSRVIIVPETFYTRNDTQRGYSWSCNIHMYAGNMKTVGTFTIVAKRKEDYIA